MSIEERIEAKVRATAGDPIITRVYRYDDISPEIVDSRATDALGERKEIFALAMYDFSANNRLAESLPLLAHVAVRDGDTALLDRVTAQLEEMTGWSPLQRPGYTLFQPGPPPEPDHNDGSWLATGVGVWAIVECLRILGDRIDVDLKSRLDALLAREIDSIFEDFASQRQWFTKRNGAPACNQWVLPLCGIVEAAIHLGTHTTDHAGAYEMAVAKLNRSLDTQGESGDFVEGFSYASFTLSNWLRATRTSAAAGDTRLASHPYLPLFAEWLGQMVLPELWIINACDCGVTRLDEPTRVRPVQELIAELVLATRSGISAWLAGLLGLPDSLAGIQAGQAMPNITPVAPSTSSYMRSLGVIAWRTGWASTDHAVWIRTSGGLSSHTHADSAHVSCYRSGRPILIEAGTPVYGHTDIGRSFGSAAGHNVLQLGTEWPEAYMQQRTIEGWQRKDTPVEVSRCSLTDEGGTVEMQVDPLGYSDHAKWRRTCQWDRNGELVIEDSVTLDRPDTALFRFHLGVPAEIVKRSDRTLTIELGDTSLSVQADMDIKAEIVSWPGPNERVGDHQCLVIQTAKKVADFELKTRITGA